MPKKSKRDFSSIGTKILSDKDKRPNSLAEMITGNEEAVVTEKSTQSKKIKASSVTVKPKERTDTIVKDGIAIPMADYKLINDMMGRCMKAGQRATKSDIYRAAIRCLNGSSDKGLLNLIVQVRKDKKTHN